MRFLTAKRLYVGISQTVFQGDLPDVGISQTVFQGDLPDCMLVFVEICLFIWGLVA